MRLASFVILLFTLVLVAACLQRLSYGSTEFGELYRDQLNRVPISSPADLEECQEGKCWCMVCKNNTPMFPGRRNLIGGYCYIDKDCKTERFVDLNNPTKTPDTFPLQFMIGQGPTFGDFGISNTYCSDRLSMSVQWLVGSSEASYLLPDAKRAMCFLSKGIMPVFILYSNGTNINVSRARRIGEILRYDGKNYYNGMLSNGPVGPVMVVTEMNFDKSQASLVAEQVRAVNQGCNNDRTGNKIYCFVAVAPKINDFEALNAVMDALGTDTNMVDLVAYGIDGRYTNSCSGSRVILEALNFSSYSLYNLTKPTLIPYIMFDNETQSASGCTWTEQQVVSAYGSFFPFAIQSLQKRGVIGIAPYTFNSTAAPGLTNPLNCTSCSVAATSARMSAWYGGCQKYTVYSRFGTGDPADTTQILFGNTSGTSCNTNAQMSYLGGFTFSGKDLLQPVMPTQLVKANLSYSCDMCLTDNLSKPLTDYFSGLQISRGMAFVKPEFCDNAYLSMVNQWSSARNLDPMFIRAVIVTESGFKPCEVAKVCGPNYNPSSTPDGIPCFDSKPGADECYYRAYDEIYIPANTPGLGTSECPEPINDRPSGGANPQWRWCAFGMMQSLEPPASFWPAAYRIDGKDGDYVDVYQRAGISASTDMDAAKACDPVDFNPFTASDSICVGTAKMQGMMETAKQWIQQNKDKLNWDTVAEQDKTNIFAAYIAANKYSGLWDMEGIYRVAAAGFPGHPRCTDDIRNGDCWAIGFKDSWTKNEEYCQSEAGQADTTYCKDGKPDSTAPYPCAGYTDFIKYVEDCEVPFLPVDKDRGRVKMEAYIALATNCADSTCPDGKQYFELGKLEKPKSGTPYLPDNLQQTQP